MVRSGRTNVFNDQLAVEVAVAVGLNGHVGGGVTNLDLPCFPGAAARWGGNNGLERAAAHARNQALPCGTTNSVPCPKYPVTNKLRSTRTVIGRIDFHGDAEPATGPVCDAGGESFVLKSGVGARGGETSGEGMDANDGITVSVNVIGFRERRCAAGRVGRTNSHGRSRGQGI